VNIGLFCVNMVSVLSLFLYVCRSRVLCVRVSCVFYRSLLYSIGLFCVNIGLCFKIFFWFVGLVCCV